MLMVALCTMLDPSSNLSTQQGFRPQTVSQGALRGTDAEAAPPFVQCWGTEKTGVGKEQGPQI